MVCVLTSGRWCQPIYLYKQNSMYSLFFFLETFLNSLLCVCEMKTKESESIVLTAVCTVCSDRDHACSPGLSKLMLQ